MQQQPVQPQRREPDQDSLLREQQRREFEQAQEADMIRQIEEQSRKEHEQQLEAERKAKQRAEEEKLAEIERQKQQAERERLEQLAKIQIPEEPPAGPDVAEIVFRSSAGGKKISRRFQKTDSVKLLYDYIRTLDPAEVGFEDKHCTF